MTSPPRAARASRRRWRLGGAIFAGLTAAVLLAATDPSPSLPKSVLMLASIALGSAVTVFFYPWADELYTEDRRGFEELASALERIVASDDASRIALPVDTPGLVGQVARHLTDIVGRSQSAQRQSRILHQSLEQRLRAETARLEHVAMTEPLTGLGNRRALQKILQTCFEDTDTAEQISAMVIDLDNFKAVNDTLGHAAGDEVLVALAQVLRDSLRRDDQAVRLGGDEFAVIMPCLDETSACAVAERIAQTFRDLPWKHKTCRRPELSIGIATALANEPNGAMQLIRRADDAMYATKRANENATGANNGVRPKSV